MDPLCVLLSFHIYPLMVVFNLNSCLIFISTHSHPLFLFMKWIRHQHFIHIIKYLSLKDKWFKNMTIVSLIHLNNVSMFSHYSVLSVSVQIPNISCVTSFNNALKYLNWFFFFFFSSSDSQSFSLIFPHVSFSFICEINCKNCF